MSDPRWLISARFDLGVFLAPAAIALLLVPLGPWLAPDGDLPVPFWIVTVLAVDVAHVWATLYRTYLDRDELRRRPLLYALVPIFTFAFFLVAASWSSAAFWTALAYLAVFHFVRQQYGWVALYERKDPRLTGLDRVLDRSAIYAATLFPILWWHAHLPRRFDWFMPGDFLRGLVPAELVPIAGVVWAASLIAFAMRQIVRRARGEPWALGKIVVVSTTAACWGVGIVATDSDWAFTVTNVLIHGVPYFGIVWVYGRARAHRPGSWLGWIFAQRWPFVFLALVIGLAGLEELSWDRWVWHNELGAHLPMLLPLLALPQAAHYVLDGFIWRRGFTGGPGT